MRPARGCRRCRFQPHRAYRSLWRTNSVGRAAAASAGWWGAAKCSTIWLCPARISWGSPSATVTWPVGLTVVASPGHQRYHGVGESCAAQSPHATTFCQHTNHRTCCCDGAVTATTARVSCIYFSFCHVGGQASAATPATAMFCGERPTCGPGHRSPQRDSWARASRTPCAISCRRGRYEAHEILPWPRGMEATSGPPHHGAGRRTCRTVRAPWQKLVLPDEKW